MTHSEQLRIQDVDRIHRLIGECRDLGADPVAWRKRLIEGIRELIGGQTVLAAELAGSNLAQLRPVSMIDAGWTDAGQRKFFFQKQAQGIVDSHPMYLRAMRAVREGWATVRREDLIEDREWYRLPHFNEFDRECGLDAGIMSIHEFALGDRHHFDTLTVRRPLGAAAFSLREKHILQQLHRRLVPLIGRNLASGEEPSPAQLAPRAQETLQCLLEGDSEKQVAARLGLSQGTVHAYVKAIYRHFGVAARAELLARWIRFGRGR